MVVDYEIDNNNGHLFMGTLLKSGERAVFDYSYPDYFFDGYNWKMSGLTNFSDAQNYTRFSNFEEQNIFLSSVLGKPLTFVIIISPGSDVINISENTALIGSKDCQDYLIDLYNLVPIVEEYNVDRPNDNEQSALYFTKDNVLCDIAGFTIRKP